MTLEMHYREKYEEGLGQGLEQAAIKTVLRILEDGKLSLEEMPNVLDSLWSR